MSAADPFFVAGGTVPPGSPSYVERAADRELFAALLAGEFCFVLNSRQMGKSSLAVRTIGRLQAAGVRTAFVDLTRLGATGADPERWYAGLLMEIGRATGLRAQAMAYLKFHAAETPAGRVFGFLADETLGTPLVVFVDEVDATRTLPFPADDLFAGIRQAWNARATDARYKGLTFCLMGAALPGDLIRDPRMTPFNVGRRIELRDFTPEEARPFAVVVGESALARVLHWTGGHPYLTQAICAELADSPLPSGGEGPGVRDDASPSPSGSSRRGGQGGEAVNALVRARYLDARARDTDTNLADVANRLLGTGDPDHADEDRATTLSLYDAMLRGRPVADDEANPAAARIKMSGVARVENGRLKPRNRIYARAFDARWARGAMPGQELRRQRRAFWRGALRAGTVGALVVAVVSGLAVAAVTNERKAQAAQREADRQRRVAEAKTLEARDQRDAATKAKDAVVRTAADLKTALARQKALGEEVTKERDNANGQTLLAQRSAALARRNAAEAVKNAREALRNAAEASRNAAEAKRQRLTAEGKTREVLESQKSLKAELYDNAIQSLQPLWERGDRKEMARVLAAAPVHKDRGWEWGYWKRLSKVAYDVAADRSQGFTVLRVPSEGSTIIRYDFRGAADLVDARTGKSVRSLWRLPRLTFRGSGVPYRVAYSQNGRWVVRDDASRRLVMQDILRGTIRPLPETKDDPALMAVAVSDDGQRYLTWAVGEKQRPSGEFTVWDAVANRPLFVRKLPKLLSTFGVLRPDGRTMLAQYDDASTGRLGIAEYDFERDRIGSIYAPSSLAGPDSLRFATVLRDSPDALVIRVGQRVAVFRPGDPQPRTVVSLPPTDLGIVNGQFSVSNDGHLLLVSPRNGPGAPSSEIWDLQTGKPIGRLPISNAVLSGDGRLMLNSSRGAIQAVGWREAMPYQETTILQARPEPDSFRNSPDESSPFDRLTLDGDGSVLVETVQNLVRTEPNGASSATEQSILYRRFDRQGRLVARFPAAGELPMSKDPDPAGSSWTGEKYLYVPKAGGLEVRRLSDFRLVRTLLVGDKESPYFSADARRAASIDASGLVRIWRDGPSPVATLRTRFAAQDGSTGTGTAAYILFSPSGNKILVQQRRVGFEVRELSTLRRLNSQPMTEGAISMSWQDDDHVYLSGIGTTQVLDLRTGKRSPYKRPSMGFGSFVAANSPDGRLRAESKGDGTVEIRSLRSNRRLFTLDVGVNAPTSNAPPAQVVSASFSKDGRALELLYADGRLRTYRGDF